MRNYWLVKRKELQKLRLAARTLDDKYALYEELKKEILAWDRTQEEADEWIRSVLDGDCGS